MFYLSFRRHTYLNHVPKFEATKQKLRVVMPMPKLYVRDENSALPDIQIHAIFLGHPKEAFWIIADMSKSNGRTIFTYDVLKTSSGLNRLCHLGF